MARKDWTPIEIDGVRYELRRGGFMDTLKLSGLCARVLGEPVFRALATSSSLRDTISKLSSVTGDQFAAFMKEDVTPERMAQLAAEHLPSMLDMLGDGAAMFADNLTDATLEHVVRLAVLGKLKADDGDGSMVLVEDTRMLDDFVGSAVEEHGVTHQFKLLWACVRHQAGPTKGGRRGSRPTEATATAPT